MFKHKAQVNIQYSIKSCYEIVLLISVQRNG